MKKFSVVLMMALLLSAGAAYAGHVENSNCLSAEYYLTSARTGATDAADIAMYNPAGTVFLPQNGLFMSFSSQFVYKNFENEYAGTTYEQDEPSYSPSLSLVYRQDDWAAFFVANSPAGTGGVNWKNGSATTAQMIDKIVGETRAGAGAGAGSGAITVYNQSIEASSVYIGLTLGGAYKINSWLSISAAGRYITADRKVKAAARFNADLLLDAAGPFAVGTTTVDLESEYEYEAQGFGGIFGIDIRPFEGLNIGLRYETVTRMEFEYTMKKRNVSVTGESGVIANLTSTTTGIPATLAALDRDGQKFRYDLPATFSIGAEYIIMPGLAFQTAFDYFFVEQADWAAESNAKYIHDGWEVSAGLVYQLLANLKIGAGIQYTDMNIDPAGLSPENPVLDNWTFTAGVIYNIMPDLALTIGANYTYYLTEKNATGTVTYDKTVAAAAFGIQYRLSI